MRERYEGDVAADQFPAKVRQVDVAVGVLLQNREFEPKPRRELDQDQDVTAVLGARDQDAPSVHGQEGYREGPRRRPAFHECDLIRMSSHQACDG
ncbi:hypothetical protein PUN71_012365 [Arthrobacter sp. NQ7]|uniref:hypothetical protein n=1 Tax=Arthrobacter sp. NQ7 TaxID=3032303 RepID=UPI0024109E3E|nr:hypothetical protein [Arthrobacter sp. NQ7]MDJ0457999.1 hypothetical protein [Arthrobacter sp. NQ7]